MRREERYKKVLEYFQEKQPVPETELRYADPYELLVAVILSAQCTDKRVNMITPVFFERFPDAYSLANAGVEEVFRIVRSCSYPNNKSKYLVGMARMLITEFGGEVPADTGLLQKLPGVGRKTANVVASVIYNMPAMAVDTHVYRVSARIGLVNNARTPLAAEMQLIKHIPREMISRTHHWLILHGRYVCVARKPKCGECGISQYCKYYAAKKKQD
ncbi:MAG: endonuclease III [Bacteroidales bacterium]